MEEDIKELKDDITQLQECVEYMQKAQEALCSTGEDTDEMYIKLYDLREEINDLKIQKQAKLKSMEV